MFIDAADPDDVPGVGGNGMVERDFTPDHAAVAVSPHHDVCPENILRLRHHAALFCPSVADVIKLRIKQALRSRRAC